MEWEAKKFNIHFKLRLWGSEGWFPFSFMVDLHIFIYWHLAMMLGGESSEKVATIIWYVKVHCRWNLDNLLINNSLPVSLFFIAFSNKWERNYKSSVKVTLSSYFNFFIKERLLIILENIQVKCRNIHLQSVFADFSHSHTFFFFSRRKRKPNRIYVFINKIINWKVLQICCNSWTYYFAEICNNQTNCGNKNFDGCYRVSWRKVYNVQKLSWII